MTVICPDCGLVISHIVESREHKKVTKRIICVNCSEEFTVTYPTGSRHQFNAAALGKNINVNTVSTMGE